VLNPKSKIQNLKSFAAAALSGILLVVCFPKIHCPGIVWVACLPLLAALAVETRLKHAFLLGYVCGAFYFAGNCYWFLTVTESYGHLSSWLAVLVLIGFVIIDSVFFGGFGLVIGWAARRSPGWALTLSPFLWVAMELARTYLITGFPWDLLGYAVQAEGVRQIASVTGVYGLSFLPVATSALGAWAVVASVPRTKLETGNSKLETSNSKLETGNWKLETRNLKLEIRNSGPATGFAALSEEQGEFPVSSFQFRKFMPSALTLGALSCWIALLLVAQSRLAPPRAVEGKELAILIQPNVPLDDAEMERWSPWRDPTELRQLVQFSIDAVNRNVDAPIQNPKSKIQNPPADPPLLIWAENPAPFFFTRDPVFHSAMENLARQTHTILIANTIIPTDGQEDAITNSAVTLDPDGREIARYDKIHLVPFGEYVPGWALPGLVHKITSEVGNFVPGTSYPVARSAGGGIGVFICYEAIIPQLARKLVANGAGVLVNISNDAWYGDSAAAYQHLEMARLRAIENHRYLLRATNNGLTTLIDPYGRVLKQIPRYQRLAMPANFDFETEVTFYTAHGDLFAWMCAMIGTLLLIGGAQWEEQVKRQSAKGKVQK